MDEKTFFRCVEENDLNTLHILCLMCRDQRTKLEERDYYGNTPLLKACYLGRLHVVDILLKFNANYKAVNYFGQNALTLATYSGNFDIICKLLLYCSYEEYNKSTITPAICVASMLQNYQLYNFFVDLDRANHEDIETAHGNFSDNV